MVLDAHKAVILLGQELGYPARLTGYCQGVAVKWLESCLLGEAEQQRFERRIETILTIEAKELAQKIQEVRTKVKRQENLTDEEDALSEFPPFYEGLELYFSPKTYPHIFNQSSYLIQDQVDKISQYAASARIEQQGGLACIFAENRIYSAESLSTYLNNLKIILDNPQKNVGILLSGHNHTISLHYDSHSRSWTLMDINYWPPLKQRDSEEIASTILEGGLGAINCLFIAPSQQENLALISELQDGRQDYLRSLTKEIAQKIEGTALLFRAAQKGDAELVKVLLSYGGNISVKGPFGTTLLCIAAQNGHLEVIRELVRAFIERSQKDELSLKRDCDGVTPLWNAAYYGYSEVVHELIVALVANDQLQTLSLPSSDGSTPLYAAAQNGHVEVVRELVGALVDNGKVEELSLAMEDATPLASAAESGHLEVVRVLVRALVDNGKVDALSLAKSDGATPLYIAVQNGHVEVVRELVQAFVKSEKVAALSLATSNGMTPLHIAIEAGHWDVVRVLIEALEEHGIPEVWNIKDKQGRSPHDIALQTGRADEWGQLMNQQRASFSERRYQKTFFSPCLTDSQASLDEYAAESNLEKEVKSATSGCCTEP